MAELPPYGDPTTQPFWEAAYEHRLVLQQCQLCVSRQLYPRPFCLACGADQLRWVDTDGTGVVYSQTTVRVPLSPHLPPPYQVALVQLDDGPRLTANIVDGVAVIGDAVQVSWINRDQAPPLPVFALRASSP